MAANNDKTGKYMRRLSVRVGAGLLYACLFFAVAAAAVGAVGIIGVRSATRAGNHISTDELASARATAATAQEIGLAYDSGQALLRTADPIKRTRLATALYDDQIPAVDGSLGTLRRLHARDDAAELTGIDRFVNQWIALRAVLNPLIIGSTGRPDPALADRLSATYAQVSLHVQELIAREDTDGRQDQRRSAAAGTRITWAVVSTVVSTVLIFILLARTGARRLRAAIEPGEDQVEFAATLQLAGDEDEAHRLLKRHLERTVTDGTATILNRNNSADRLEAVTGLPSGSPLVSSLAHAEPRSCLAVRSGRTHGEDAARPALLGCPVCASCPGASTCTPLTVSGEVIGSVLVNRPTRYTTLEHQRIRESVGQAAPVLANLRNLAIAELRAATDSLTGLPNKRAVGDTLKRMLAQASRTLTPLSLLVVDLDNFKAINDQYGHPAGDQALANVGAALQSALRDSDFAGRTGGEEFAIILPDTDTAGAVRTAEKIRASIAEIGFPGLDLSLTGSVGVAAYPEHATGAERLERLADSALYVAKRSGRDRVEIASQNADPTHPADQFDDHPNTRPAGR